MQIDPNSTGISVIPSQQVRKKKPVDKTKKTPSSGVSFVSKLRDEIELQVREEYEKKFALLMYGETEPLSPQSVLLRDQSPEEQQKAIRQQYKILLSLCEHFPEQPIDKTMVERIYNQ